MLVFLSVSILFISIDTSSSYANAEWSYHGETGPDSWPTLFPQFCAGQNQSPIDIRNTVIDESLGPIEFQGYEQTLRNATIYNSGETVQIIPNPIETYRIRMAERPNTFRLAQFHFHWGSNNSQGSEHTINGKRYPLEAHFVHFDERYGTFENALNFSDGLAVLAVLFEKSWVSGPAIRIIAEGVLSVENAGTRRRFDLLAPLISLFPNNLDQFYRYNGSLTTPRCNEVVTWTVFKEVQKITNNELKKFRTLRDTTGDILEDNFRPVQPINDRTVFQSGQW